MSNNYVDNSVMYKHLTELRAYGDYDPEVYKLKKKHFKLLKLVDGVPDISDLTPEDKEKANEILRKDREYRAFCENRLSNETKEETIIRYSLVDKVKNRLGAMFLLICNGTMKLSNFTNYSEDRKSDMVSEATWAMSRYMNRYNLEMTNPFAYFTTICYRAYQHRIDEQNKYSAKFKSLSFIENLDGDEISIGDSYDR